MTQPQQLLPLAFPLHGSRLIEASAGTGKTYTLAALYLRLVLGHGAAESAFHRPLMPPDILVVTFTRAATAELRDRIRARLVEAATAFRAGHSDESFLGQLLASYDTALYMRCAGVLERAAQWMDEAAVFTIHSWCQRMLSEHAFDSGMAFGEQLADDNAPLLHTLACDYWRTFLYPLSNPALLAELGAVARSPEALLKDVQPWLQADAQSMQFTAAGAALPPALSPQQAAQPLQDWQQQLQAQARQLMPLLTADVLQLLDDAFSQGWLNGNKFRSASWQAERQWWQAVLAEPQMLLQGGGELEKMAAKFSATNLAGAQKKGQPLLEHALFDGFDGYCRLLEAKPQLAVSVRHHAALWLEAEFRQRKKRRAELDFNDLLRQLHQALAGEGGEVLAARIRAQYPVAMVDEFQDTDPLQFAIFRAIYPPAYQQQTALLMVGDPKQAIYSFRGADLHTYLQARDLTAGRHYSLSKNFRSSMALVDAVNALFNQAEQQRGAFGFGTADDTPLPFTPVEAQGKARRLQLAGADVSALNYWLAETEPEALKKGAYQAMMAQACADQIALLLRHAAQGQAGFVNESGDSLAVQPADIAILVRDRNEAALVRQQLSLRNIRSVYLSDNDSIFHTEEAATVLYWLRACHQLEDDNLLRAALALPLSQNSDHQLQLWLNDEQAWEQLTEQIRYLRQIWRHKGVLAMLSSWLHYFALPAKWLAGEPGERSLTNVLHLAELLQAESQQRDGEAGLIRWLAEQLDSAGAGDEQQLRLESDEQLVQVVTIHKSKGLQYNLVFLPFICGVKAVKKDQPQRYFNGSQMVLDLTPDDAVLACAERERLLEDIRLLYVALTRPVYACWLGLAAYSEGNSKKNRSSHSALGYLLALAESAGLAEMRQTLAALPWQPLPLPANQMPLQNASQMAVQPALSLATPLWRQRWWIASYSALRTVQGVETDYLADSASQALSADTALDSLLQEELQQPLLHSELQQSMHDFPRGAVPGTFLHQLLEDAQQQGFANCDSDFIQNLLQHHLSLHHWQHWQAVLQPWLMQMLQVPLAGVGQSLAGLKAVRAELEFWLQSSQVSVQALDQLITAAILPGQPRPALAPDTLNGMLKGFIDLTLQAPDGRYWVLDYKSNWLGTEDGAYSEGAMQQALLEKRYDVQAALYLLALHRLLKLRQPGYLAAPERYLGGALYWFIRAPQQGQLSLCPPQALLTALDKLFAGSTLQQTQLQESTDAV